MAEQIGFSVGFDLNGIEKAAQKADAALNKIIDTGNRLESALTKNFKNIVLNGVSPFLNSLTDAETKIAGIGKIKGVSKTIDDVNKLTAAFREVGAGTNYSSIEQSMSTLMDKIKILKAELDAFESLDKKGSNILNVGDYEHIGKVADELNRLMKQYETLDNTLKQLKSGERLFQNHQEHMDGASLAAQKENHELEKLNESFRNGTSLLQRQAKEQDAKDKEAARIHQEEMRRQEEKNRAISDAARVQNILSGLEPQSLNNLTFAISKMKEEQKNLDLSTREGVKRYKELEIQIRDCEKQIKRVDDSSSKLTGTITQLGGAITAAFSVRAIMGYAKTVAEVRGEFELQQKSLQALVGDIGEANKLWDKTVKLAVNSPFRVKELVRYTKQLSAYRVETEKIYDKTKMLADISAGLGVDMNRLILAYGQVKAANYLRGTELRQFSEAGINILEELSKYFEAIEGRAVSVGEVFERVSKRMVSFADVDAVLQKVTSEGGAFYKMQEKQSETLKGLIANLKDSVDLMLNQIGTVNEGFTKGAIKSVKSLIDNWRLFAELVKNGAVALSFALIVKSIIPLANLLTTAAIKMDAFTVRAIVSKAPLKQLAFGFKELTAAMLSNPLFLGAAAITGAVAVLSVIRAHAKEVKEANKVYEEAAKNEAARAQTFRSLTAEIEKNNNIIKNSQKGTKEYNSALEANEGLLKRLKKEYPKVTEGTVQVKDDITEVTAAIAAQNEELRTNIALQYMAKGSFGRDDLRTNYADVLKELGELDKSIETTKASALDLSQKLEYAFRKGIIDKEQYSVMNKFAEEVYNAEDATTLLAVKTEEAQEIFRKLPQNIIDAYKSVKKEIRSTRDESYEVSGAYEALRLNIAEQKSEIANSIEELNKEVERGEWVNNYLEQFDIIDKRVVAWAKKVIQKMVSVKIEYPNPTPPEDKLEPWAQRVTDALTVVNDRIQQENKDFDTTKLFPLPNAGELKEKYLERVQPIIDLAKKKYAEGQQIEDETTVMQSKALNKYLDDVLKILNIFDDKTGDEDNKVISKRISLIKNLREEYLKLNQTFNAKVSYNKVFEGFKDAFEQAGMNLNDIDFTSWEGIIAALSELKPLAEKEGKEAKIALQKEIGEVQVKIDVTETQDEQQRILEQIENMFGNYEISLELDKLNIPPDLAKKIFGIESMDLSKLRDSVMAVDTSNFGKGALETYNEFIKKIDKMEEDARMERLKTYTEYLTKEQNTRVRMKLEELRKLEEVRELYQQGKYNKEQYDTITGNIRREAAAEQAKQTWEDFSKTPYIVQMFDDLDKTSNKSLKLLNDQLQALKTSLYSAGLPASELKEILDKINQVEKELEARNPFAQIGSGLKDLFTGNIDLTKFRREYDIQIAKQAQADKEHESAVKDLNEYNEKHGEFGGNQAERQKLLDTVERTKQNAEKLRDATQQATENFENAQRKVLGMAEGLSTVLGYAQQLGSAFGDMADKLGIMSEEEQAILNSAMNVVGDVANIGMAAAQIAANPTNPAAWVQGISSVMSLIGNIAATGDAVREKEIQAEMKKIDRLEKAYERLANAMEEVYTFDQMQANRMSMEQNIDDQIKSLESAKAKEEAKKKADEDAVQQYADDIEELREKKTELEREMVETMGGTYDYSSVAEQFLDSWLESFRDTGNGLRGLEDNFDEFFSNIAKNQIIYDVLNEKIKPLQDAINADLGDNQEIDDWSAIIKAYRESITNANEALLDAVSNLEAAGLDIFSGDGSELSGLSKGIQGITETQAGILEAYWNAVRLDVSAIRERFDDFMSTQGYGDEVNPVENHLKTISMNTTAMLRLLEDAKGDSEVNAIRVKVLNM